MILPLYPFISIHAFVVLSVFAVLKNRIKIFIEALLLRGFFSYLCED